MKKVITYGTYDLLHYGHVALLKRAKELGDYLIVGVTSDAFDKGRGKLNVQQSVVERIEAVRQTGLADEIIVEEYEGQKIADIKKYDVDIFAIGSDWLGKFDYLKEFCDVVYLKRTEGISSSELRENLNPVIRLGIIGTDNPVTTIAAGEKGRFKFSLEVSPAADLTGLSHVRFSFRLGANGALLNKDNYIQFTKMSLNAPKGVSLDISDIINGEDE